MLRRQDAPRQIDAEVASAQAPGRGEASGHVALLAATALGFAYAPTGADEAYARRLATLAGGDPEALPRAQAAVLTLEIGCTPARTQAAALLRRATRNVIDPGTVGLSGGRGGVGALTVTTEGRP